MTSKISCVKLIRENIRHRMWLAALCAVAFLLMMPVYSILYLNSVNGPGYEQDPDQLSFFLDYLPTLFNCSRLALPHPRNNPPDVQPASAAERSLRPLCDPAFTESRAYSPICHKSEQERIMHVMAERPDGLADMSFGRGYPRRGRLSSLGPVNTICKLFGGKGTPSAGARGPSLSEGKAFL